MEEIYLGGNKFEGPLPSNLSAANLRIMNLPNKVSHPSIHYSNYPSLCEQCRYSPNKLSGNLNASYWNTSSLFSLDVASNSLTGDIDPAVCNLTSLLFLDMSDDDFAGSIPNCNGNIILELLNMSGNSISGSPCVFFNCSRIEVLDLSYNQFIGTLDWTQYLSQIMMLLLGGNLFEGRLSPNLCNLQFFTIIDLSDNRLVGSLPPCIGGMSFGYHADDLDVLFGTFFFYSGDLTSTSTQFGLEGFTFFTKGNSYTYDRSFVTMMMFGIDLSRNMLSGEIPWEAGNMSRINQPCKYECTRKFGLLSSLEVFSVAYNNLSGCIPDSGQFGTFNMESYKGNKNLKNMSLDHRCSVGSGPVSTTLEDIAEISDDPILYV
ncbi:hypothetical protein U9M48_034073, partial [Paspalum notatum var. saurae]